MSKAEIFDRNILKIKRDRAAKKFSSYNFLHEYCANNILDRISKKKFFNILNFGVNGGEISRKLNSSRNIFETDISYEMLKNAKHKKIIIDEENIPFANESFDLILSNLVLNNINDVPGCLIQLKNCLKKNGVFVASIFGGTTLFELRESMMRTEIEHKFGHSPHISPFIDVKDLGLLAQRAGFDLPVSDSEIITVTYPDSFKLMHDIRGMGNSNILLQRSKSYLGNDFFKKMDNIYKDRYSNNNGEIEASFEIITITAVKLA